MSEENTNPEISEEEILMRYKRAHLSGWMTQQIVGGNVSAEDAAASFKQNDAKADKLIEKYAKIRETVLEQVNTPETKEASTEALKAENQALKEQLAQAQS